MSGMNVFRLSKLLIPLKPLLFDSHRLHHL